MDILMPLSPGVLLGLLPVFVALLRLTSIEAARASIVRVGLLLASLVVKVEATRRTIPVRVILALLWCPIFLTIPSRVILPLDRLVTQYVVRCSDLLESVFI